MLPSILFGTNVIYLTNTEIEKLQRIENSVYRKILGATKNTARVALRREVGASAMKTRIVVGKLQYLNSVINGKKRNNKENNDEHARTREKVVEEFGKELGRG